MLNVYLLEHVVMEETHRVIGIYTSTWLAQEAAAKAFREEADKDRYDLGDWESEDDCDVAYLLLKQDDPTNSWRKAGSREFEWFVITPYELIGGAW